ncbi:Uncharacterised protein [uncultured archaeon]|nr:Uncharacterised protein [uncultured archaeon]
MPHRVKEETDNLVVLDEDPFWNFIIYLLIAFAIFVFFYNYPNIFLLGFYSNFFLLGLLLALLFLSVGLNKLLNGELISFDKTHQSVVIKRNQDLKYIPFQAIKEIRVIPTITNDGEGGFLIISWNIFLNAINGESIKIFNTERYSELERVSKRIGKITKIRIPLLSPDLYYCKLYESYTGTGSLWSHDLKNIRKDEFILR